MPITNSTLCPLRQHVTPTASRIEAFPDFLKTRFSGRVQSVDGILCWDLIDYLDRRSAIALTEQLSGLLRPEGALLGFFGTAQARDRSYSKYVVVDGVNMKQRGYPATRGRQTVLQNRDIIRLFERLRVSDSFLLQNNLREILFRKPAYETR